MNNKDGSHIELALLAVKVFADDGTIDIKELDKLLQVALRDDAIDEDEKFTLRNIFKQVQEWDVSPVVWRRIAEIREKFQI